MDIRQEVAPALIAQLHAHALEFSEEARGLINDALATRFEVRHKADASYVTSADTAVEQRLRERIAQHYPEHGVIGEEFPPSRPQAEFQWVIDPIDGTEDFVHRVPTFGSILALYYRDVPLVGIVDHPALGLRCHAAYGRGAYRNDERVRLVDQPDIADERVRLVLSARANFMRYRDEGARFDALARTFPNHRIYRSCYGHALAAIGAVDAMVDFHDTLWDLAAARVLVEEAGGSYRTVRDFRVGDARIYSAVFGRPALVARVCDVLASG